MRRLLTMSLLLAGSSLVLPWAFPSNQRATVVGVSFLLAIGWIIFFLWALTKLRIRGLWLLLGLPLISYWPFMLYLTARACAHDIKACP
jgi:predicted acyltransferase